MTDTKPAPSHQLIGIQYLRAIAALMVAYFHALGQIPQYTQLMNRYLLGGLHLSNGVDLFFVISGFIMVLTSSNATPLDFAARRIIRIVPLYWALTTLLLVMLVWRPELLRSTVANVEFFVKSLLFIPYPNPGQNGQLFPLLVPGWSLNLEMFFYAVFTLLLCLPRNHRIGIATVIFSSAVGLAPLVGHSRLPHGREMSFFGDFKLFEFLFGMLIAEWYSRGLPRPRAAVSAMLAAAGFTVLFLGLPFLDLTYGTLSQQMLENGLPAALIVFAMLSLEDALRRRPAAFVAYLGDASYSMYLGHLFFLGAARFAWSKANLIRGFLPDAIAFAAFALAATIVGTILLYRTLELPLLHVIQRTYRRLRAAPQAKPISSGL